MKRKVASQFVAAQPLATFPLVPGYEQPCTKEQNEALGEGRGPFAKPVSVQFVCDECARVSTLSLAYKGNEVEFSAEVRCEHVEPFAQVEMEREGRMMRFRSRLWKGEA